MNYLFVSSCYTLITISIQSSVSIRFYYVAIAQQNKYQRNVTVYQKISYRSNNDYEKSADYIVSMIMIIILRRFYRLTFLKEEQRLYDHESSSLSLLLHQIFTLAKIFLPHMLLIKLTIPLCSLSIVKLFLALGICVFSDSYIVLHPCTDYVLISCSRLPAASNIQPGHAAALCRLHNYEQSQHTNNLNM